MAQSPNDSMVQRLNSSTNVFASRSLRRQTLPSYCAPWYALGVRFWELEAEWDEDNIEHIARHGVDPEEVEEIVYEDCHPSWIVHGRRRGIKETRWTVFGQTCGGRYLIAVIAPYPQRGVWRAVTARDMELQTQRRYRRWREN